MVAIVKKMLWAFFLINFKNTLAAIGFFCNQLVYNKQISMAVLHKQSFYNKCRQTSTLLVFSVHGIRTSQDEIRAKCSIECAGSSLTSRVVSVCLTLDSWLHHLGCSHLFCNGLTAGPTDPSLTSSCSYGCGWK